MNTEVYKTILALLMGLVFASITWGLIRYPVVRRYCVLMLKMLWQALYFMLFPLIGLYRLVHAMEKPDSLLDGCVVLVAIFVVFLVIFLIAAFVKAC